MMSFHPLTKANALKFVGSNLAWLLAITSLVLGRTLVAAEDRTSTEPPSGREIRKTRPCLVISPDEMNRHIGTVRKGATIPRGFRQIPTEIQDS